ncbi:MAG: hypothetical protein VYE68_01280 [Acidobacteriota bacterium]|nr:hypothetical protein [Acidobacteriota bacterium]
MAANFRYRWSLVVLVITAVLWSDAPGALAQTVYRSGQSVQPVYEGWNENQDGTFTMWFGYLNRNYEETPIVPVGPDNHFSPGPTDRGQSAFFYPRRQNFVFSVTVPANWGDQDLVWTVIHDGTAYTAVGSLWPTWVVDEGVWRANRGAGLGGRDGQEAFANRPPTLRFDIDTTVTTTVGRPVTLTVLAGDDGQPGPQPDRLQRRQRGYAPLPNDLPTIGGRRSGAASGVGGPTDQNMVKVRNAYQTGLAVTWLVHRGSGAVMFDPSVVPVDLADGQAFTTATFSRPGIYIIRAVADDGSFATGANVTVRVHGDPTDRR